MNFGSFWFIFIVPIKKVQKIVFEHKKMLAA